MSAFDTLSNKLSHEKGVTNPDALAATIGRRKYGKKGFQKKIDAGRHRQMLAEEMEKGRDSESEYR